MLLLNPRQYDKLPRFKKKPRPTCGIMLSNARLYSFPRLLTAHTVPAIYVSTENRNWDHGPKYSKYQPSTPQKKKKTKHITFKSVRQTKWIIACI